jgi:hypothetical protein
VVSGAVNLGYKAVKGTVNGISWAVSKAKGKIDEDRVDGTWKVVGVYKGSFEDFSKDQNPDGSFTSDCTESFDQIIFKAKKSKFKPVHCSSIGRLGKIQEFGKSHQRKGELYRIQFQ